MLAATVAAAGAFTIVQLAGPNSTTLPANAAIQWRHPFTFRSTFGRTFNYASSEYTGGYHHALDYQPGGGTPVCAVAAGVVDQVEYESSGEWWGNYVRISHGEGYWSSYAHLRDSPLVNLGESVPASRHLGFVGDTGYSFGAHLHLEIMHGGASRLYPDLRVDPHGLVHNAPLAGVPVEEEEEEEDILARTQYYYANNATGTSVNVAAGDWWVRESPSAPLRRLTTDQINRALTADGLAMGPFAAPNVFSVPGSWFIQAFADDANAHHISTTLTHPYLV